MLGQRLKAVEFLLANQTDAGAWFDFDLEPGQSDCWVTAFVSLVLVRVAARLSPSQARAVQQAVELASSFLTRKARVNSDGLPFWGYNDRVPPDADSTAHVALLLEAISHGAAHNARRALRGFVGGDGGISTFRRHSANDRWGSSHPDVTAVAVRALSQGLGGDTLTLDDAVKYLLEARRPDGTWPAFWWTTPLFATAAVLRLFRDVRVAHDRSPLIATLASMERPTDALDLALYVSCSRLLGLNDAREATLIADLWQGQCSDGSWLPAPRLRVTDAYDARLTGPVHLDPHRLYTTASVLHALRRL